MSKPSPSNKVILLLNLGTPQSPRRKDVKKYLKEFLMDKRVIDIPFISRYILVNWIIAPFRSKRSAKAYQSIWQENGSPLLLNTISMQNALQLRTNCKVAIAMRYGNPAVANCLEELHKENESLQEIIVVPLYPHFAMSSYETAVEQVRNIHQQKKYASKLKVVAPFYNHPSYISALASTLKPFLNVDYDSILFSYHGIPERHILKSDTTQNHCLQTENCCEKQSSAHTTCYRHQTFETTKLVAEALNLSPQKIEHSFQSRLGRAKWLTPYTSNRLEELPKENKKNILVVCPAFICDCLETLEEIKEEGKEKFLANGGKSFTYIPCLNDNAAWIDCLEDLIATE